MKVKNILVIGSYNGQDSFGDKCLLRCVSLRMRHTFGEETNIITHVHVTKNEQSQFSGITLRKGFCSLFHNWHSKLRHLRLPYLLHFFLSFILFPAYIIVDNCKRGLAHDILEDIKISSMLYFYGGTQLSKRWFWLNYLPLIYTLLFCAANRVPVYFGPQQYGPLTKAQKYILRATLYFFVERTLTRNKECVALLQLPKRSLVYDELFSAINMYPIPEYNTEKEHFIMLNMRESNFTKSDNRNEEFDICLELLTFLQQNKKLGIKLFQMSGRSFCDDSLFLEHLKKKSGTKIQIECIPVLKEEAELLRVMGKAFGTLSMSFHGCIFSIIAGTPAIPIIVGDYYGYKYNDFYRYVNGQDVPILHLKKEKVPDIAEKICTHFKTYRSSKTDDVRKKADELMKNWYRGLKPKLL